MALKEMTPQPSLDTRTLTQLRHQFEQEATVLAPLNHPHLQNLGSSDTTGAALGDLDGDGDLDAFTANFDGQPSAVWFNR
jgi:hypothetical protein